MADISSYIKSHLLEPLKNYPTIMQDTMIDIITEKLQSLYDYTIQFPEILSPNQDRLDILQAIASQFLFTLREDADLQEQVDILDNILYVYRKRGSVDTIENMWKYYGGTLPKDVEVYIPSYDLFRYSISKLSGTHAFSKGNTNYVIIDTPLSSPIESGSLIRKTGDSRFRVTPGAYQGDTRVFLSTVDGLSKGDSLEIVNGGEIGSIIDIHNDPRETTNRPGVYEIKLYNNTYPIPDLKEFLIKELLAAGNSIYFSHILHSHVSGEEESTNYFKYLVQKDSIINIQLKALNSQRGMRWSAHSNLSGNFIVPEILMNDYNRYLNNTLKGEELDSLLENLKKLPINEYGDTLWSGKGNIFLELYTFLDIISSVPDTTAILLDTYNSYVSHNIFIDKLVSSVPEKEEERFYRDDTLILNTKLYCTPMNPPTPVEYNLYDKDNNEVIYEFPGVFILGDTLLGDFVKGIPV